MYIYIFYCISPQCIHKLEHSYSKKKKTEPFHNVSLSRPMVDIWMGLDLDSAGSGCLCSCSVATIQ